MKIGDVMKKNKLLTSTLVFSFLLLILILNTNYFQSKVEGTNIQDKTNIIIEEDVQSQITEDKLSMVMVGDALLHSTIYKDAFNGTTYDFSNQLKFIKPIINSYDLGFYNQETILGGTELGLSTYPRFNSPQEFGDAMIDAGFNIVSLANNHTLDRGEKAIINSSSYWKSNPEVLVAGSYASLLDSEQVNIKKKNNITYTLLAYTTSTNGLYPPSGKEYFVNIYNEEKVKSDYDKVKDLVDIVIVSMHWGSEYVYNPTSEQIEIANYLASLGVDIVIGHHPHVVQPITKIENTLVFYSLGNFISAQENFNDYERLVGLMSSIEIIKTNNNDNITIEIKNTNNEFIYTYRNNNWRDVMIIPFSQMSEEYNLNYRKLYSKYSEIVKRLDESVPIREP